MEASDLSQADYSVQDAASHRAGGAMLASLTFKAIPRLLPIFLLSLFYTLSHASLFASTADALALQSRIVQVFEQNKSAIVQ